MLQNIYWMLRLERFSNFSLLFKENHTHWLGASPPLPGRLLKMIQNPTTDLKFVYFSKRTVE